MGKVQIGIRYERGPPRKVLSVAVVQASGIQIRQQEQQQEQQRALQEQEQQQEQTTGTGQQGLVDWLFSEIADHRVVASLEIRRKESKNPAKHLSPAANFSQGSPVWRHVFQFVDFPEEQLERCQLRIELRQQPVDSSPDSSGSKLHLGETTVELTSFAAGDETGREGLVLWRFLERSTSKEDSLRLDENNASQ